MEPAPEYFVGFVDQRSTMPNFSSTRGHFEMTSKSAKASKEPTRATTNATKKPPTNAASRGGKVGGTVTRRGGGAAGAAKKPTGTVTGGNEGALEGGRKITLCNQKHSIQSRREGFLLLGTEDSISP